MGVATMRSVLAEMLPWRVRVAGRRMWSGGRRSMERGLATVGLAPASQTDRVRSWEIPPVTICHLAAPRLRSLFLKPQFECPDFQRVTASLKACAKATRTTLDPSKQWEIPVLLAGSRPGPGDVCLDVGSGSSCLPVWLDGVGCEVFAVDPEMRAVSDQWSLPTARIHANGGFINYVRRSATDLPFKSAMFDHVFCVSVIEHLPVEQRLPAIREMIRVTRPGGTVAISTDVYPSADQHIAKAHAHVFNLKDLQREILDPMADLLPVYPVDLSLQEGLDQHLRDLKHIFNARHSFFAEIWRKPASAVP